MKKKLISACLFTLLLGVTSASGFATQMSGDVDFPQLTGEQVISLETTQTGFDETLLSGEEFLDASLENIIVDPISGAQMSNFASYCQINGQQVPCEDLKAAISEAFNNPNLTALFKTTMIITLIILIVSVLGFIFRMWMLIDAIKYEKQNPVVWILVLIFAGIIGAIIYFFAVKIERAKITAPQPTLEQ